MKLCQWRWVSTTALAFVFWASRAITGVPTYVEDFSTTQYKYGLNTTAWWDTASGELKLFPFVPTLAGSYGMPDVAEDLYVSGSYAFVVDKISGLQVIDISDPTAPSYLGSWDTPGTALSAVVSGDHAYVANYTNGLTVIDISDPTAPFHAGSYNTPDRARGVAVSGDYAYVADWDSGLQVVDISDPTAPAYAGSYDTPDIAAGVAIWGDYAYVADWSSGLQVIDISDPTAPAYAGSYDMPGSARRVVISGDYAYVADYSDGLQVIDISDPAAPTDAGHYSTVASGYDVAISGDYAYVAKDTYGLQVLDISDPTTPTDAGTYNTSGYAYGVDVWGDYAYVADYWSGLQVIDIADPTAPASMGSYNMGGYAWGVAISGDYAYVADDSGLRVLDISDPTTPAYAGSYITPGNAYGLAISGDYAFVADYGSGVQVFDISDPTTPAYAGSYNTPGNAFYIAISGDYAYVADQDSGLQVVDVRDPTAPGYAGNYDTPSTAWGLTISGDHAYIADGTSGLQVIDISDPTTPTYAGSYNTPGNAYGVAISGDYAYVADYESGFQVLDISDPTTPAYAGSYNTPGRACGVTISGGYAYVADWGSGLQVLDISNPATPAYTGSNNTLGSAHRVAISGDCAYVADHASGLQVIQVFQREVNTDDNVGWSFAVDASNDTIFGARLMTTQTDAVTWELSADGGVSWQAIAPDGSWNQLTATGIDLVWRSTHAWAAPGVNPAVTQLEIGWLVEAAAIDSIADVPDDQGGWVRAYFTRSGRDFSGELSLPIEDYGIWQRVDNPGLIAALSGEPNSKPEKHSASETPRLAGVPVIKYQGRTYVQSRPGLATSSFPPGTWEWLATVPAIQHDTYIARVPTVADSSGSGTNHAVFVVTAHTTTPSIWYISDPDSGYSLDNIAPAVPTSFAVAYNTGSGNALSWDPCPDQDFQYFCVYRSNDLDFDPTPSDLVHTTTAASWNDPEYDGWNVYYQITALDYVGNESPPASAGTVTAITEAVIPQVFALYQNVPNPFNPATVIRYDVPARGGVVTLRVYDVGGRLVRTLVDGTEGPGEKTVTWDGRNDRGRMAASGVYFYRLTSETFAKTRKMLLMK